MNYVYELQTRKFLNKSILYYPYKSHDFIYCVKIRGNASEINNTSENKGLCYKFFHLFIY